jgi:hypothetical protein
MDTISIILISILFFALIILIIVIFNLNKKLSGESGNDENLIVIAETLKNLKNDLGAEIRETRKELDFKINAGQKDMNESARHNSLASQKLINDVMEHLLKVKESVTEVKEGNKQVFSMTEQLSNLEKVLTNQKHRGN